MKRNRLREGSWNSRFLDDAQLTLPDMSQNSAEVPLVISGYARLWAKALAAANAYNGIIDRLREEERTLIKADEDWKLTVGRKERVELDELRDGIRGVVTHEAMEAFSPPGTRLEVDGSDFDAKDDSDDRRGSKASVAAEIKAERVQRFDPVALWKFLAAKYGNGKADEDVFRRVAGALVSAFDLRAGEAVRTVGGRMALTMRLYWDDNYGGSQWGYSSQNEFNETLGHLRAVMQWAGLYDQEADSGLAWARRYMHDQRGAPKGLRWDMGEQVTIVPFKSKAEFRLAAPLAAKLQEFIGLYGTLRAARKAA